MVRKAPATTKHKGSQKNEAYMAGITGAADFLQNAGNQEGINLDQELLKAAGTLKPEDVTNDVPFDMKEE